MADGLWQKAIPPTRDQKQSRGLVLSVGTALLLATAATVILTLSTATRHPAYVFSLLGISVGFAVVVWLLRAATPVAAAFGGMICLLVTCWTGTFAQSILHTGLTPLAMLFVITFLATRAGRRRKAKAGLAESRKGRSAAQVIANLSVAALCATPLAYLIAKSFSSHSPFGLFNLGEEWIREMLRVMCLAALVEATADTVSSEIGQAYGGAPRMLLSLQRVKAGTDGAVTTLGTLAGVVTGFVVAQGGAWGMHLFGKRALIAAVAGCAGLLFDSLLGATVERRGWLGNDLVNFSSTAFAAAVAGLGYWLWIR